MPNGVCACVCVCVCVCVFKSTLDLGGRGRFWAARVRVGPIKLTQLTVEGAQKSTGHMERRWSSLYVSPTSAIVTV
jgi:hypothetical protein